MATRSAKRCSRPSGLLEDELDRRIWRRIRDGWIAGRPVTVVAPLD
ncbi:hypothetical protein [Agromyces sp. NPDC058126]